MKPVQFGAPLAILGFGVLALCCGQLAEAQIGRVEQTRQAERRIGYYAPVDGYVMELGVRQGAAVQPETMLFQLAALDTVWINVDVPETQAAWIKAGDRATTEVPALPGERFEGSVDFLYPELSAATRTLKLRLVIKNSGQHLRPGMFASVHLLGTPKQQVLMVPTEAVIKTGARSVVVIADDASHFQPTLVRVGAEYAGQSEIVEGLSRGQQVVASGQFLIDSEANLRGAFENLTGPDNASSLTDHKLMPAPSEATIPPPCSGGVVIRLAFKFDPDKMKMPLDDVSVSSKKALGFAIREQEDDSSMTQRSKRNFSKRCVER